MEPCGEELKEIGEFITKWAPIPCLHQNSADVILELKELYSPTKYSLFNGQTPKSKTYFIGKIH